MRDDAEIEVVVSLEPGVPVSAAAARLRTAGLRVTRILEALGVVCGSIAASRLPALAGLPGIASVEEARSVQLPPPESPLQ